MKKIVTILGARPQFVKAAVLSRVIANYNVIEEVIIHTGQHYDSNMSALFFEEMKIPQPKYNLEINGLSHGAMTGQMLMRIEELLVVEKPDAVLVYGDTNSTLAGALAAKKMDILVVHVEAGLRSFNMKMPEEINRIITDRVADLLLCPTTNAIENLITEGFKEMDIKIVKSGDIMKCAVNFYDSISKMNSSIINDFDLVKNEFVLATIHRQENTDDLVTIKNLFEGLEKIGRKKRVILPLHPRTRAVLEKHNLEYDIDMIDPVGYLDMLALLKNCELVITDSGGLQKEAYFCGKFCIIAREETEWIELVDNGFAKIAGSDTTALLTAYESFQNVAGNFDMNLYGDNVGELIYSEIVKLLSSNSR